MCVGYLVFVGARKLIDRNVEWMCVLGMELWSIWWLSVVGSVKRQLVLGSNVDMVSLLIYLKYN